MQFKDFPTTDKILRNPELWPFEVEMCARDFWYYALRWGRTKDPNYQPTVRRFPDTEYLRHLNYYVDNRKRLIVEKSRRMLFTWYMSMKSVHKCLFSPNQAIAIQSRKQTASEDILGKRRKDFISFILENNPAFLYELLGKPEVMVDQICFPNGSMIAAIAQGPDQLRQYALSMLFVDEAAHQEELELAIGAAYPTLQGGGQAILGSSVAPGYQHELAEDESGGTGPRSLIVPEKKKLVWCGNPDHMGMQVHENDWNGYTVIRLHYTADPSKDPCTEKGNTWFTDVRKTMSESLWNQEYELDARALAATQVIPEFKRSVHLKDFTIDPKWTRYHTLDIGIDAPTAGIWAAVSPEQDIYVYDIYYRRNLTIRENAMLLKEKETHHVGLPYVNMIDPAAFDRMYTGTTPALEYAKVDEGAARYYAPANNDIIPSICVLKQYMHNTLEGRHPAIYFLPHLTELFWELSRWRFKPGKDKPNAVDDHLMSCLRYLVMIPPSYIPTEAGSVIEAHRDSLTGYQTYHVVKTVYDREVDEDG